MTIYVYKPKCLLCPYHSISLSAVDNKWILEHLTESGWIFDGNVIIDCGDEELREKCDAGIIKPYTSD